MKVTESAMSAIQALDTPVPLPTSGAMVIEAVEGLGGGGRGGLSLQSIKKYIAENHVVVDQNKQDALTRKAVKKLVDEGKLVQVKGTGASGSFKLAAGAKKTAVVEKKKPTVVEKKTILKKKSVLKIKITSGRKPAAKSSRKSPSSQKSDGSKKDAKPKADADMEPKKKTIPKKSSGRKDTSKTTPKTAAKKQSSKKKLGGV